MSNDEYPIPEDFAHLGETDFMRVFEHPGRSVVLAVRKAGTAFPLEDVTAVHRAITTFGYTETWGLIFDTRPVTGNSDPRFEEAITRVNDALLRHFSRMAVLVRSAIGQLQAERLVIPGERMLVTADFDAALNFVAPNSDPSAQN
ncbi:hypothetical protein G6O69_21960 [Pseudenhygromyxa sp. WMMC2535]|uniref:hypothetical protein n=1 Tax=Pseudenhygromyxa sp. WMMC2535 TaxID=2712867 RepID=UPI001551A427|nr:hypothetical protein [Pseudenhygromyxa sp. WMMC2535]NVB40522.1 hypothetical protein [Pseudenhygromyxa sp. WMMC2535]